MLQHALRIGVRRHISAPSCTFRALNTPATQVGFDQNLVDNEGDSNGTRDTYNGLASRGDDVNFADRRSYARIPTTSVETRPVSPAPSQAEIPRPSREKVPRGTSSDTCESRRPSRCARNSSRIPNLCSTFVDVDSLAPHEMAWSNGERLLEQLGIAEDELQGVLRTATARPSKKLNNSLLHPVTPQELELRLHQAMTFTPLPSLARLISYHDSYPSLHSAPSYNFLVQLAIRHTSYTKAFQLLRRMEEMGINPDNYSKLLYVRLLVRIGRWNRAWLFVRHELSSGDEQVPLPLLLELLGHCKPLDFRDKSPSNDRLDQKAMPMVSEGLPGENYDPSFLRDWQENILAVIPNHLPSNVHPPDHFILTIVRHLLQNSRTEVARAVTLEWISHLPKHLTLPRKRRCLSLLHLHLAFSLKTFTVHFANRQFVKMFLEKQPNLRPNSSTLFLLLRSLTRAKGKPTFHALQLVQAFRRRWGSDVIDRRVRRRVVSIALREGRLEVARTWLEAEDQASLPRKFIALQRQVVGEQAIKLPQKIRRVAFQKLMPGIHDENRKWRWAKRRFWRLEQSRLSKRSQTQVAAVDSEKNAVDQASEDA